MSFKPYVYKVSHISKSYGKRKVLDDVSLEIDLGDIYCIVGLNGSGKTTLFRVLLGIISNDDKAYVNLINQIRYQGRVSALIEKPILFEKMTVYENLKLIQKYYRVSDNDYIEYLLRYFDLFEYRNIKPKALSLGNRQKLAIISTLVPKPEIVILDEPTNGLDPQAIVMFRKLIKNINKEFNTTFIISSHLLSEVHAIAKRVGFLGNKKIIAEVPMDEINASLSKDLYISVNCDSQDLIKYFVTKGLSCSVENSYICFKNINRDSINEIITYLSKHNIDIIDLYTRIQNFEDYFLKIYEKGERE